jgi:hypothetical protein
VVEPFEGDPLDVVVGFHEVDVTECVAHRSGILSARRARRYFATERPGTPMPSEPR